jgi:Ca2+-binding EF-hand superfamily protein
VVTRIFYAVNTSGTNKITLRELKKSNLLVILAVLDQEEDINKVNDYFSYEHFYVIYCKFWELDQDHDLFLDYNDLLKYEDFSVTSRVIERIFMNVPRKLNNNEVANLQNNNKKNASNNNNNSGNQSSNDNGNDDDNDTDFDNQSPFHRNSNNNNSRHVCSLSFDSYEDRKQFMISNNRMSYDDFVIFLISEVDKSNPVSLEYWFRCIDLDGDGKISTFEIEYFFEEQRQRIQMVSQETITFPGTRLT